jgi:hypothetical protein
MMPARFCAELLKMDIEGEEPAALRGAQELLRAHRPHLAISIYHRAEHLWEMPSSCKAMSWATASPALSLAQYL